MANKFPIFKYQRHFAKVLQYAPGLLGNHALNFFNDRFREQGWLGYRFEKWKARKNDGKRKGRAILIDRARLKRGNRIVSNSGGQVVLGNDTPYAKAHNDGFKGVVNVKAHSRNRYSKTKIGTGKYTKNGKERTKTISNISGGVSVKAHTKRMNLPQRKFMGASPYLSAQLQRLLMAEFKKVNRSL